MKFQKFYKLIKGQSLLTLLCGFTLIILFCFFVRTGKATNNKIWMNVKYLKCLRNKLPCECENQTKTYFTAMLDTNRMSKFFGIDLLKYDQMEFDHYSIRRKSMNYYEVFESNKNSEIFASLFLSGDTLTVLEKKDKMIFVSGNSDKYDENQYGKQNTKLLNVAFKDRGYDTLEKTLNQDSLDCFCNKWIGKINLISVTGKEKAWIIEQHKDSTYIYVITNNPGPDDSIVKKLFKKYKWKNEVK